MTEYERGQWEYANGHDPDKLARDSDYWKGWVDSYNADL